LGWIKELGTVRKKKRRWEGGEIAVKIPMAMGVACKKTGGVEGERVEHSLREDKGEVGKDRGFPKAQEFGPTP